jgi:hypothetical protein
MERKPRSNQDAQDRPDAQREPGITVIELLLARRCPNQGGWVLRRSLSVLSTIMH